MTLAFRAGLLKDQQTMTALAGTLSDMSMVNLIQIFGISRKTGILMLDTGTAEGSLFAQDGQVVDAVVVDHETGQTLVKGEEAFYTIMGWSEARFAFNQKPAGLPPYPRAIAATNDHLIMEGLRRSDEEARARALIGYGARVTLDPERATAGGADIRLNDQTWRVLTLVMHDVRRVADLAKQSGLGEQLTLVTVAEMIHDGLLQIESEAPADAPVFAPAAAPWSEPAMPLDRPPLQFRDPPVALREPVPAPSSLGLRRPPGPAGEYAWLSRQRGQATAE